MHRRDDAGIIAEVRKMNGTASSLLGDDEMMRAAHADAIIKILGDHFQAATDPAR